MNESNDISNILRKNNLKVTPQRLAIFNFLANSEVHPSAETIYNYLHPSYPTMSLATVYKTLKTLKEHNLIQEINIGEDSFRYDVRVTNHPHKICLKCKEVSDLPSLDFQQFAKEIIDTKNFTPMYEQIYIYGICFKCDSIKN